MADVGAHVYDFFRQRYGPVVAAGIVGNTQQESSNNPNAAGGGLIQGQGGRTSSGSLQQQLHGIDAELNGPERHTLAALRTARTPQQAALIFSQRFERPGEPRNDLRTKYAVEAFHRYGGRDVAHATAAGSIANEVMPHIESGPNEAQSADLVQALSQALNQKPSQPAVSAPRRPQSAGGREQIAGGPRVPQAAQEAPQKDPTAVLSVLSKLAADQSPLPEAQNQQHAPSTSLQAATPQASERLAGIVQEADKIGNAHVPYLWGGGHAGKVLPSGKVTPLDCSGAVSAALGLNPKVASEFQSWGAPGKGKNVTIWSSSEHVLMEVNGRFWGTSASNPGGGAGWIKPGVISPSYLKNFVPRHPAKL